MGQGTRATAQGQGVWTQTPGYLEPGDSIRGTSPFLVAALDHISASKTGPVHIAPKTVPFLRRDATFQQWLGHKAVEKHAKSTSELLWVPKPQD